MLNYQRVYYNRIYIYTWPKLGDGGSVFALLTLGCGYQLLINLGSPPLGMNQLNQGARFFALWPCDGPLGKFSKTRGSCIFIGI